jgi:hypothetical protein
MNYRAGERKVLIQAAVRIAALILLILFIEIGIVANKFMWLAVLYLIPIEVIFVISVVTSFKVLDSLRTALARWFVVPLIRWIGRGA